MQPFDGTNDLVIGVASDAMTFRVRDGSAATLTVRSPVSTSSRRVAHRSATCGHGIDEFHEERIW